ncbi:MAG: TonB-dependent receptor [Rikenellaceae bacterium]|nr:TonB-dependent receptor [Rikenellaceae bacterium]
MIFRPKGLLTLLLATWCAIASAQHRTTDTNIAGHVVDAASGKHIPYATITVNGTTLGTMTDATGHYFLKNIPIEGKITLSASSVGYRTAEMTTDLRKGKTQEVNFTLSEDNIAVDQVVVSANRNESSRRTASTIVNVVGERTFATTASNNLAEALNYKPGLRVEFSCQNCGVPQLRINGLEGQYSQILLDSRPIFSSLATVYGLEQLPVGMVERVEVVRGGGSALFGSNAIGGVVNIITKEPVRNTLSLANTTNIIGGKSFDANTTLNGAFVSDDYRAGVYVFGMIRDREAYDRDNDGFSEIPRLRSETIGFRGYYKTGAYSKLTAEYHHIREFRRGGNLMDRPPHEADIAEQLRHGINGGGLRFALFSKDYRHKFEVYAAMQGIDRDSYFGTNQNPDAYGHTSDKTFSGGTQYAYSFNRLWFMPSELTVGFEYNRNNLHDQMLGYDRDMRQLSITYGGYLQNEWKNERLSLLVGGRLDKNNRIDDPVFSPRVSVRYTPDPIVALRASYSSGYRAPQAYDEDLHVAAVGNEVALIVLAPDLKPEYSHSLSASVDLTGTWERNRGSLLIEGFYTTLRNVFALRESGHDAGGNLILERYNASGAKVKGINLEGELSFDGKVTIQAGYTLQQSRYKEPHAWSENPNVVPVRRMLRTPDNYGYAGVSYQFLKRFNASVYGNYTGNMLVPHFEGYISEDALTKTRSFWDMGLRLAYTFALTQNISLEVSGGVKNIFDSFQPDLDKGASRDAKYIYGPALPRTYFFGVKFAM